MGAQAIRIIARLRARPGRVEDLQRLLAALLEPTRNEAGCMSYTLLRNREDPAEFAFVEMWENETVLERHLEADHVRKALERFPDLLAGELDMRRYELIG